MFPLRAVLLCIVTSSAFAVHAQIPVDTVRSFMPFRGGVDTLESALLTADHDITHALSQIPGGFVYDFNTFAWPTAWSMYGLPPHSVRLHFGPIFFDDLLTGRARYDLLPTALLMHPVVDASLPGGGTGVQAELRTIDARAPHTQLHYQAGDHKLQRVTALHAQQRNRPFNQHGHLQGVFAYAGASDAGDYPGSRLQRQRQLLLRTRYQRTTWSLELLYLHNQRRLGAHSGVLGTEDTRYNRLIAQVIGQEKTRRTVRNDFLATMKTRILTGSVYYSTQSLRYADVSGSAMRIGTFLQRGFTFNKHRIRLRADAYVQRILDSMPVDDRTSFAEVQIGDSLELKTGHLLVQAGVQMQDGKWFPKGYMRWEADFSVFRPHVAVSYRILTRPASKWGSYLVRKRTATGQVLQANTGMGIHIGRFMMGPYGFISKARDAPDYQEISVDSVQVVYDTYTALGTGVWLDFATDSDRGPYAGLRYGYTHTGRTRYGVEHALPKWTLAGRFGLRAVLFKGDLHLDISVRGRSWSAMTSRTLHAPTGLLVLPSDQRQPVNLSHTLDLVVKGSIRTATVYVLYENMTSGTELMAGNELVADYPLPSGQLRFGVYWPISN